MPGCARNAPCPCGSGRKHKRCCLQLLEDAARASREEKAVFKRLLDYVAQEHADAYEEAAALTRLERLLRGPIVRQLCAFWAIADYLPDDGGPPLAARYASQPGLAPAERELAARLAAARLDVHRVIDAAAGAWVDIEPLAGGEPVRAIGPRVSATARPGQIILTRVMAEAPIPSLWGAGLLFDDETDGKWTALLATVPEDRADAALALLRFEPADHAEPLPEALRHTSVTLPIHDGELVLDALEDDARFESLGQELGGDGWAFAQLAPIRDGDWRGPRATSERSSSNEAARVVVEDERLVIHATDPSRANDLVTHLGDALDGLLAPVDRRHAA